MYFTTRFLSFLCLLSSAYLALKSFNLFTISFLSSMFKSKDLIYFHFRINLIQFSNALPWRFLPFKRLFLARIASQPIESLLYFVKILLVRDSHLEIYSWDFYCSAIEMMVLSFLWDPDLKLEEGLPNSKKASSSVVSVCINFLNGGALTSFRCGSFYLCRGGFRRCSTELYSITRFLLTMYLYSSFIFCTSCLLRLKLLIVSSRSDSSRMFRRGGKYW